MIFSLDVLKRNNLCKMILRTAERDRNLKQWYRSFEAGLKLILDC